jgi:hypothetical protein
MTEPVAVLVCVFGGDRLDWFVAAITSVVGQDYKGGAIRIYLGVDGPLPYPMEEWITQNRSVFHKIVRNEVNLGLSKTLNRLVNVLEDEPFVFRMDADDLCLPYRFSRQIAFFHDNPDVDVLGGAIWEFNDSAPVTWKKTYPCDHEAFGQYIVKANPIAHSTVCFRKGFFAKISAYPETSRYNQDLALWYAALYKGVRMANLDLPILCLRTSDDFFYRRGYTRAASEFRYYLAGIYCLHGVTWRMVFPCLRFLLRLFPSRLTRMIYGSSLRSRLCRTGNADS